MRRLLVNLIIITPLLLLGSCQSKVINDIDLDEPVNVLPRTVSHVSDKKIVAMEHKLSKEKDGVRIITMGQQYMLSIPADRVFPELSPHIRSDSYAVLNDIVCYLKAFRKTSVYVRAFTNSTGSPRRELALTKARANAIADYFWEQGIDARFIFAQGLSRYKPIAHNLRSEDRPPNSRIEIVFYRTIL